MASKKVNMLDVVQKILKLDTKMRFAAIIDPKGKIREAIINLKEGSLNISYQIY